MVQTTSHLTSSFSLEDLGLIYLGAASLRPARRSMEISPNGCFNGMFI